MRVRAWFRTPVVSDEFLPLDGVLLYQAMRRRHGPREATLPGATADVEGVRIPLEHRNEESDHWYHACSFAWWGPHSDDKAYWEKRLDAGRLDIVNTPRKIDTASGRYRLYHMPIFYRSALYVDWYACGDMEIVADLLSDVWAMGKKTSQGWGRVSRWEISNWDEDLSWMRAVPVAGRDFDPSKCLYTGFRPPYWLPSNQTICELWMNGRV